MSSGASGLALALVLVLAACAPPDRPDALPPELPATALHFLEPGGERSSFVSPGVGYTLARSSRGPWTVHLLRIDLARCDLGFTVLPGSDVSPQAMLSGRLARLTDLASDEGAGVIAAVNGDFFNDEGKPLGLEVSRGAVRARSGRTAFAWHPGKGPWFGVPTALADSVLFLGWELSFTRADGRTEALAGFPALLRDGKAVGDLGVAAQPAFAGARHPRTAVAYDSHAEVAWLVVVEGRVTRSAGMSLPELTALLLALGATEALNLDGGGSSAMVVHGKLVSRSSDSFGERPVANALGLRRDSSFCAVPRIPPSSSPPADHDAP